MPTAARLTMRRDRGRSKESPGSSSSHELSFQPAIWLDPSGQLVP